MLVMKVEYMPKFQMTTRSGSRASIDSTLSVLTPCRLVMFSVPVVFSTSHMEDLSTATTLSLASRSKIISVNADPRDMILSGAAVRFTDIPLSSRTDMVPVVPSLESFLFRYIIATAALATTSTATTKIAATAFLLILTPLSISFSPMRPKSRGKWAYR